MKKMLIESYEIKNNELRITVLCQHWDRETFNISMPEILCKYIEYIEKEKNLDPSNCKNYRTVTREIGECGVTGGHCSVFDGDCVSPEDYEGEVIE